MAEKNWKIFSGRRQMEDQMTEKKIISLRRTKIYGGNK
jgi:hypothetical protein